MIAKRIYQITTQTKTTGDIMANGNNNSMDRRSFLRTGAAAAAAALAVSPFGLRGQAGNISKPNIILIIADDTGWNDVGYHGSEIVTPNIDRLATEGAELDQFYACPTCSPTRAAILMGRPPSRYGILGPIAGRSSLAIPSDRGTLATVLGQAGYSTHQVGKWHLGLRPEVGPTSYGFDTSYGYLHGQIDQYTHIYKNGDISWHRNEKFIEEEGHATDLLADEAVRRIENSTADKPFFLYTAFSVPHYPVQEPEEWTAPYKGKIEHPDRLIYAASMTHMDHAIGRIMQAVESKGIAQETLIVFVSDNGGQQDWVAANNQYEMRHGPYEVLGDNLPLRDWKGSVYEGGVRVPAAAYWPGRIGHSKIRQPVHAMDLMPTLAAVGGAETPCAMEVEGIDLLPFITEGHETVERTIYWNTGRQLAVRRGDWKLVHNGSSPGQGSSELFNVIDDPLERNELSDENITLTAQLRELLANQFARDNLLPQ